MKYFYRFRKAFLIICISIQILSVAGRKYSKSFPSLYNFDDYDVCLNSETSKFDSTYCMVYAEIQPQNSSQLWRQISRHIGEYKFHYRRDRLFFGVCVERCKSFSKKLHNLQYNDSRITNKITEFFDVVHKRPVDLEMRSKYHALIHNCLNSQFQDNFGLSLKTYIEYCERAKETVEQDGPEKMLYKFLQIILILNILSSLYDFNLKRKQPVERQNENFYKINPQQTVSRLFTAFSIRRNYYRLIAPYTNHMGVDLRYLDGIRSLCVIFVVIGHVFFIQYHHIKNPDTFENFAKNSLHLFLTNGTLLLEIFHVLSGFLLLIKFKDNFKITTQSSIKDCAKTFAKGLLWRYMRFLPSLALFILFNATIFTRLQDGPFWRHLTEPARTFGREKWLKNLLIFDSISESGFLHTWYINTDWQLFAFYFCIVISINKYPQLKVKIFSSLAILAVLIPLSICYFYNLEPCYLIRPESFRFTHVTEEKVFFKLYTPFYTNLGGYLFGIICGEIYEKYGQNKELSKQISRIPSAYFEFIFWSCLAIGTWICWLGSVIIFMEPSIWTALYGGLNRNLWLLIVCSGSILLGMFCKTLSTMDLLSHSAFRILARLSFQVYLWHFSILFLINGHKRDPIYMNHLQHLILSICLLLLSPALAFVITIFIEYPFHQLANCYYKKGSQAKTHQS